MDREVLLDDTRVATAERHVRRLFPRIPEETTFVTFIQPPVKRERSGIEFETPALAIFALVSPDPRPDHPSEQKMTQGAVNLAVWRDRDKSYHRMVGFQDPAIGAFRRIVPTHLDVLDNLRDLLPADLKLMH